MKGKPILTLDFDGVIHSYSSGWKGARTIPDPPVPGALQFIAEAQEHFEVHIFSSRSHQLFGRWAMKRWLYKHLCKLGYQELPPDWWKEKIFDYGGMDPWDTTVRDAASDTIRKIKWPVHKPGAMVSIDDRGLTFTGEWPDPKSLLAFKPWNKK